jgi:hypothetical protein
MLDFHNHHLVASYRDKNPPESEISERINIPSMGDSSISREVSFEW